MRHGRDGQGWQADKLLDIDRSDLQGLVHQLGDLPIRQYPDIHPYCPSAKLM